MRYSANSPQAPSYISNMNNNSAIYQIVETVKDLKITIFYNDIFFNRKYFTCTMKFDVLSGENDNNIRITIETKTNRKNIEIPLSTKLGDLFAYLRHLFVPTVWNQQIIENEICVETELFEDEIIPNSEKMSKSVDCLSTIEELIYKPLGKELVAIRNKNIQAVALISTIDNVVRHANCTESFVYLERISNKINRLIKFELSDSLSKNFHGGPNIWKAYISFFLNLKLQNRKDLSFDMNCFIEMLMEINRIVELIYLKHQLFLSDKDKSTLLDSIVFLKKLQELKLK